MSGSSKYLKSRKPVRVRGQGYAKLIGIIDNKRVAVTYLTGKNEGKCDIVNIKDVYRKRVGL